MTETYAFYPPRVRPRQVPYQVLAHGAAACRHELLSERWCDRISVRDSIIFITFSCKHCERQICQSLDEVLPPSDWSNASARAAEV